MAFRKELETNAPHIQTNNISYRFADSSDAESLSRLAITTYKESYQKDLPYYTEEVLENMFSSETFFKDLENPNCQIFICEKQNQLVAYAKWIFHNEDLANTYVYLDKLYVLNAHQRAGIGHTLFNKCMEKALENDYTQAKLTVWDENTKAIHFYKKHGFKTQSRHEFSFFGKPTGKYNYEMACENITLNIL